MLETAERSTQNVSLSHLLQTDGTSVVNHSYSTDEYLVSPAIFQESRILYVVPLR